MAMWTHKQFFDLLLFLFFCVLKSPWGVKGAVVTVDSPYQVLYGFWQLSCSVELHVNPWKHYLTKVEKYQLTCWGIWPSPWELQTVWSKVGHSQQALWSFKGFGLYISLKPTPLKLQGVWSECISLNPSPLKLQRVWSDCRSPRLSPLKLQRVQFEWISFQLSSLKLQQICFGWNYLKSSPLKLQRVCVECVSLKLSPLIDFHVTININKGLRLIYHNALCSRALFDLVKHSQEPVYNVVRLRSKKLTRSMASWGWFLLKIFFQASIRPFLILELVGYRNQFSNLGIRENITLSYYSRSVNLRNSLSPNQHKQ